MKATGIEWESWSSQRDTQVDVNKLDPFTKRYEQESVFKWHVEDQEDMDLLVNKLHKIMQGPCDGPFGFSRRSTYIKKLLPTMGPGLGMGPGLSKRVPMACSGNFIDRACVESVVVLDENGKISTEVGGAKQGPMVPNPCPSS